jgi:3-oxoacid CoA-transferase subunit B
MEVSENGDIANWMIPGKMVKGMGGAMDLVAGVKRVVVIMDYISKNEDPKFVPECSLPLTGKAVVDLLITTHGVFENSPKGFVLTELADGITVDEIQRLTKAKFTVSPYLTEKRRSMP